MGIVPVAYSLFAVALGIAAGAMLRRVLPAMIVTLAGFIAARALVAVFLRSHYMSVVTVFHSVTSSYTPPGSYWQLGWGLLGPNGQLINQNGNEVLVNGVPANLLPASCAAQARGIGNLPASCSQALTHFRLFFTYQPGDRYWAFQGIETGIFLALAAVLIAVTAVTLLRRDA
jgi:hypothetical protein